LIGEAKPVGANEAAGVASEAARKRAAVELIAKHERSLRRTARRYSICADDADDAYQRGLEILLRKAPTDDVRELVRWTTTVVKHEALKVRQSRERTILSGGRGDDEARDDWVAMLPSDGDGPAALVERREKVARSREALQALKPQELRALTLLAEGYSYEEIGAMTGFSQTRVNRCLAEGRERFRAMLSRSEDGSRCEEMGPLLSAFCDGEVSARETAELREHLRACSHCRATLRAYRAAPRAAAALAPLLPVAASRSLMERAHDAFANLYSRLPGQGGAADSALSGMAAGGGAKGAGMAGLAKVVAACVGTVGGAAACVATGVMPAPLGLVPQHEEKPAIVRQADAAASGIDYEPAPALEPAPVEPPKEEKEKAPVEPAITPEPVATSTETAAVENAPPPAPASAPAPAPSSSASSSAPSGNPAGEFGP
jgi:RNA polymerase sigma factor (sigma-70 family)